MKTIENPSMNPERIAKAFYGEPFKVESPEVTLHDFQIEGFVDFTQANINRLKDQAQLKDSPTLEMIARFFQSDLDRFKVDVKRRVMIGGMVNV